MFPFFLVAAAVLAIAAGSKSGWRTSADMAAGEAPLPAVQGLGPGTKSWFIWKVNARSSGPYFLTNDEAIVLEHTARLKAPRAIILRWMFDPKSRRWLSDLRTARALHGDAVSVGAVAIDPPITGRWIYGNAFPVEIAMNNRTYRRALWSFPRTNVVAQYREAKKTNSQHLFVMNDGTYVVDHIDEANPDQGMVLTHFLKDVLARPQGNLDGFGLQKIRPL